MPAILQLAPSIRCPVLYLCGDREPPDSYPAEEYRQCAGGPCDVEIVDDCDHFYNGRESEICRRVAGWLRQRCGP